MVSILFNFHPDQIGKISNLTCAYFLDGLVKNHEQSLFIYRISRSQSRTGNWGPFWVCFLMRIIFILLLFSLDEGFVTTCCLIQLLFFLIDVAWYTIDVFVLQMEIRPFEACSWCFKVFSCLQGVSVMVFPKQCPQLRAWARYWRQCIFKGLVKCVVASA